MPGSIRGAAEGRVATLRGEEGRKRELRGAGGCSAGGNSESSTCGEVSARPGKFDVVLVENETAYASYTKMEASGSAGCSLSARWSQRCDRQVRGRAADAGRS
eukprot:5286045-Prymnesium_polylepis.1